MGEVVVALLGEPGFGAAAKNFGEADGHFRRDATFSVDELGESGASDTEGSGDLSDGQALAVRYTGAGQRRLDGVDSSSAWLVLLQWQYFQGNPSDAMPQ